MVIGINGKISSGKDTVGKIIQYLVANENLPKDMHYQSLEELDHAVEAYSNFEIKKFAGKLKTVGSILTGIPVEKFEDQEFKKTNLPEHWNTLQQSGRSKVSLPMTVRELLQKLGTEAMRNGLHTNVWVNALFADYKEVWKDPDPIPHNDYTITWRENYTEDSTLIHYGEGSEAEVFDYEIASPNWIITDMRFPNEMKAVKERKGITIRVVRYPKTVEISRGPENVETILFDPINQKHMDLWKGDSSRLHASETGLDDAKFDYEIINDAGIPELIEKVREILIKESII